MKRPRKAVRTRCGWTSMRIRLAALPQCGAHSQSSPPSNWQCTRNIRRQQRAWPATSAFVRKNFFSPTAETMRCEFSGFTAVPWIRKFRHLFVARTFSKVAGLASLRLGAVVGCKESLALVRRAMPPFPVNLGALVAAEAAVQDRMTMQAYVSEVKWFRAWLAAELQKLGVRSFPSAGNFLLANFGAKGPALFGKLERQGILLRERTKYMGPGFVRISIGTPAEMKKLLKAIRKEWKAPA